MYRPYLSSSTEILPSHHIEGAKVRISINGKHKLKIKTLIATFSLYPLPSKNEYSTIVTPKDLPGRFKNSGYSVFGPFKVIRLPGRNSVLRLTNTRPLAGNAILMWPNVDSSEKGKVMDYLEKIIRSALPRLAN